MSTLNRKTLLVSVYYMGDEPIVHHTDEDYEVDQAIKDKLNWGNPDSDIFDVIVEDTKPWIFSMNRPRWFTSRLYRLLADRH
jgi:hypothetical protein